MARRVWIYWILSMVLTAVVGWQTYKADVARAQREVGQELAAQMARSAAPWILSQDLTSLNLLLSTLESRPGVDSLEIVDASGRILAQTLHQGWPGERIRLPVSLGSQRLGELRLTLSDPRFSTWLSRRAAPLVLISAVQLLFFVLAGRKPRQAARDAATPAPAEPPVPPRPVFVPLPSAVPADVLICIQPDDSRQLMQRVSAGWQAEVQAVCNTLLERVALLTDGELLRPLRGPEGALLRYTGCAQQARTWQALCAARLALALTEQAGAARAQAGLFWVPMKAGLYRHDSGEQAADQVAELLAWAAPVQQVLVGGPPALPAELVARARWARAEQLEIAEIGTLEAARLVALPADAEALISAQVQRLVPLDTDSDPALL